MLKCDSCNKTFPRVGELFEHIQSSCLSYYKSHPQSWAKILSKLGSDDNEPEKPAAPSTSHVHNTRKATPEPSKPTTASGSEVPSTSSQVQLQNNNSKTVPFVCKCEAQFRKLENFKAHLKVCTPGKEPPFCIMFRAQEADSGRPLRNVHMTVNDYFYGMLTGKKVKLKKINRRCNCYSCGKNLRNNIRFMSHVRHKIINEWEKKEAVDARNICQHCYRQYNSPFLLQCHLENVHGSVPAACTCRICELHYPSERTFLFHMKDKHVHNEAPYICKVCNYRSSFYNDVIKHFRDDHTDTSALMCPFCLAVSFNSSAFLKHVLAHIKKGSECQRCRLIFTSMKERAAHQQLDHGSQVIAEKLRKYKNLSKCQIYVRVASFQMTQRQHMMQKSPEQFTVENGLKRAQEDTESSDDTKQGPSPPKKFLATPSVELPPYLCPLKKTLRVKRVRLPRNRGFAVAPLRCMECGEDLPKDSFGLVKHYQNLHECRWCVFMTSCEKASHNHVLREHADAELREQLLGKSESDNSSFTAVLDNDDDEDLSIKIKDEPEPPPLPMNILAPQSRIHVLDDDSSEAETKSNQASSSPPAGSSSQSKPRRKQSKPMKLSDAYFENSPSPKKVRREKKVQARGFEAEKGTQASDRDFGTLVADIIIDEDTDTPNRNKKPSASGANSKEKKPGRHRKILAPEGYFPDIDDDEGWSKYFAEVEGTSWPGSDKNKITNGTQTADADQDMVPKTITTSMMPNVRPQLLKSSAVATTRGVTQASQNSTTVRTNGSALNTQELNNQTGVPSTVATTNGPVFRFQVVPGNRAPPGGFSPNTAVLRPIAPQNNRPVPGSVNKVPKMLSLVPQSPVNLRSLECTHSSMLIQWEAPLNCAVTQYKVIFQGSGAPTVQLLPPEQTLVRLVGLKSDTMYVVRVYTLCNKSVSQYAFLYQRTNKMPRDPVPANSDDIVLVVDDEPSTKAIPPSTKTIPTPAKSLTFNVVSSVSQPVHKNMPQLAFAQTSQTGASRISTTKVQSTSGIAVMQVVKPAGNLRKDVQTYLDKEKSEKMMLINELLAGFKKNKNQQKAKGAKVQPKNDAVQDVGATTSTNPLNGSVVSNVTKANVLEPGDSKNILPAKTDNQAKNEEIKIADDEDDEIFMVVDSPEPSDANLDTDAMEESAASQEKPGDAENGASIINDTEMPAAPSVDTSLVPAPTSDVLSVAISSSNIPEQILPTTHDDSMTDAAPISSSNIAGTSSEMIDTGIQITLIKSGSASEDRVNLSDKENIPVEQDSDKMKLSQGDEMEFNIVNIVSLSTPPKDESEKSEDQNLGPSDADTVTTSDAVKNQSDTNAIILVDRMETDETKQDVETDGADVIVVLDDGDDVVREPSQEEVSPAADDAVMVLDTYKTADAKLQSAEEFEESPQQETSADDVIATVVGNQSTDEIDKPEEEQLASGVANDTSDKSAPTTVENDDGKEMSEPTEKYDDEAVKSIVIVCDQEDESSKDAPSPDCSAPDEEQNAQEDESSKNSPSSDCSAHEGEQNAMKEPEDSETEKQLVCEIRMDEPIQSSEISQTEDSTVASASVMSLMPQPLQSVVSSTPTTLADEDVVLDDKTGVVTEKTDAEEPGKGPMMVFIDNNEEVQDPTGTEVDDAINEELKILGSAGISEESVVTCNSTPTLDDIKDIMDGDLSWL